MIAMGKVVKKQSPRTAALEQKKMMFATKTPVAIANGHSTTDEDDRVEAF